MGPMSHELMVEPSRTVVHRWWPAAAGVVVAVLTVLGAAGPGEVAPVVTASGFVYLAAAALGRRTMAWPAFLVSFVIISVAFAVPGFDASWVMLGLAVVLAAVGVVRGRARPFRGLPLQAAAMVVLGTAAVVAAGAEPRWSAALVATALLAHAGWDLHHHRTRRVVVRSMAQFCAVLDTVAAGLVALTLT